MIRFLRPTTALLFVVTFSLAQEKKVRAPEPTPNYDVQKEPISKGWPKYKRTKLLHAVAKDWGIDLTLPGLGDQAKIAMIAKKIGTPLNTEKTLDVQLKEVLNEIYGEKSGQLFWEYRDKDDLDTIQKYLKLFPQWTLMPTAELSELFKTADDSLAKHKKRLETLQTSLADAEGSLEKERFKNQIATLEKEMTPTNDVVTSYRKYAFQLLHDDKGPIHPLLVVRMQKHFAANEEIANLEMLAGLLAKSEHQAGIESLAPLTAKIARELRIQKMAERAKRCQKGDMWDLNELETLRGEAIEFVDRHSSFEEDCQVACWYLKFSLVNHFTQLKQDPEKFEHFVTARFQEFTNYCDAAQKLVPADKDDNRAVSTIGLFQQIQSFKEAVNLGGLEKGDLALFNMQYNNAKVVETLKGIKQLLKTQHKEQMELLSEIKSEITSSTEQIMQGLQANETAIKKLTVVTEEGFQKVSSQLDGIQKTNQEILKTATTNGKTLKAINQGIATTNQKLAETNTNLVSINETLTTIEGGLQDVNQSVKKGNEDNPFRVFRNEYERKKKQAERGIKKAKERWKSFEKQARRWVTFIDPFPIIVYDFDVKLSCSFRLKSEIPAITIEGPAGLNLNGSIALKAIAENKWNDIQNAASIDWKTLLPAMSGIKVIKTVNYDEVCQTVRVQHAGHAVYICSQEFVETYGPGKVFDLVAAYYTGTLQQEINSMVVVLEFEMDRFLAWIDGVAQQEGKKLQEGAEEKLPLILVNGIVKKGKVDLKELVPEVTVKFLNLSGGAIRNLNNQKNADRKFFVTVRNEGAGMMKVPLNWLSSKLKSVSWLKEVVGALEGKKFPHMGYAVVIKVKNPLANAQVSLTDLIPDHIRKKVDRVNEDLEQAAEEIRKARERGEKLQNTLKQAAAQEKLIAKVLQQAFGISERKIQVKGAAAIALAKQLSKHIKDEKVRNGFNKTVQAAAELQGNNFNIQDFLVQLGMKEAKKLILRELDKRLGNDFQKVLAAFSEDYSSIDLMKLGLHKDVEKFLEQGAFGNSNKTGARVDEMKFDLQTGSFTIKATIRNRHEWNNLDLPKDFRKFVAGIKI